MKKRPCVCTYYFPNWHVDPRNEVIHGKNWTEWRVAQYATPRFSGHEQPKVPLWGYEDEADPKAMWKKIKAASEHGIDAFIFDWYYFFDGSYRERCVRDGFLKAENRNALKFAFMWANHNPIYAHPGSYRKPAEPLWDGSVSPETFVKCTDHCIKNYLNQPNYLRVNDGLFFSFFRPKALIQDLGGADVAKLLFKDFRYRVEKAGLGRLNLEACLSDMGWENYASEDTLLKEVGFDSTGRYGWGEYRDDFPALEYSEWFERNKGVAAEMTKKFSIPYNPVVSTGWDSSPRTVQSDMYDKRDYPFGTVITNNTPELFEKALRSISDFMQSEDSTGSIVHLSYWNEWTEGSYLEPDTKYGFKFLEAVKKVFGKQN